MMERFDVNLNVENLQGKWGRYMILSMCKKIIKKNRHVLNIILAVRKVFIDANLYLKTRKVLSFKRNNENIIFYLGIPVHTNLGDLAQGVCIRKWLNKNYPDFRVVEIETDALVNTYFSSLSLFKDKYKDGDIIVFQSGYTTTDLGGYADEMHRAVINALPDAKMLMMPQTIFFRNENNKIRTSRCYNRAKNMLFLARDRVSYEMAVDMFPDIRVELFPDIVTTMIGNSMSNGKRSGILFCCRNDSEKFYTDEKINNLMKQCSTLLCKVEKTDTTKTGKRSEIVKNAEQYIYSEVKMYSKYELIITDRYHGTILSLVAGTPVIIIKTTDHKVITGAEWFEGLYDNYVYVADSLDDVYRIAENILNKNLDYKLQPYFTTEYYDKLKDIFEEEC